MLTCQSVGCSDDVILQSSEQTSETTHTKNISIKKRLGHWDKSCCLMADNVCLIVSKPPGFVPNDTWHPDSFTHSTYQSQDCKMGRSQETVPFVPEVQFHLKRLLLNLQEIIFLQLKYQGQNWNVDTGASSYTIWNSDMGISIIRFGDFNY